MTFYDDGRLQLRHKFDELLQRAAQAIEAPDHEDVAFAEEGARLIQP